jgi:hypothetical protein
MQISMDISLKQRKLTACHSLSGSPYLLLSSFPFEYQFRGSTRLKGGQQITDASHKKKGLKLENVISDNK